MNSEKEVNDSINFTSKDNEFTGQFKIVKDEVPTNIDEIFVSKSDFDDLKTIAQQTIDELNQATTIDGKINSILSLLTSIIELSNTGTKQ